MLPRGSRPWRYAAACQRGELWQILFCPATALISLMLTAVSGQRLTVSLHKHKLCALSSNMLVTVLSQSWESTINILWFSSTHSVKCWVCFMLAEHTMLCKANTLLLSGCWRLDRRSEEWETQRSISTPHTFLLYQILNIYRFSWVKHSGIFLGLVHAAVKPPQFQGQIANTGYFEPETLWQWFPTFLACDTIKSIFMVSALFSVDILVFMLYFSRASWEYESQLWLRGSDQVGLCGRVLQRSRHLHSHC